MAVVVVMTVTVAVAMGMGMGMAMAMVLLGRGVGSAGGHLVGAALRGAVHPENATGRAGTPPPPG